MKNKEFIEDINNFDKIIIYQIGKVASSSLYWSLTNCKELNGKVIHTHDGIICNFDGKKFDHTPDEKTLFITGLRNPLSRNISELFQNICTKNQPSYFCDIKQLKNKSIGQIMDHYEKTNHIRLDLFKNFYNIFEKKTGINVFSKDFDYVNKYQTYNFNKNFAIMLRYEDIESWEDILIKTFNCQIKLSSNNATKDKGISSIYEKFKNTYIYDQKVINEYKNIDLIKHFYKDMDIEIEYNKKNQKSQMKAKNKEKVLPAILGTWKQFNNDKYSCEKTFTLNNVLSEGFNAEWTISKNDEIIFGKHVVKMINNNTLEGHHQNIKLKYIKKET